MFNPTIPSWLKLSGVMTASTALAVLLACATSPSPARVTPAIEQPAPTVTVVPNTDTPLTDTALLEPSPTHRPRQHSGAHIEGLGDPIDTPHFVDSFPNHAQTLTQSPARVVINFDVALAEGSVIEVEHAGGQAPVGASEFDPRRIYMSTRLPADLGDGLYLVKYKACFAGTGCTDGQVGFQVDAARVRDFTDLTGQLQVTIHLKDIQYQPNQIIISPGTTVTWVNDDSFEHFVNSDPHPSHNAYLPLNSLDIPPTGNFSFTFDEPGEYAFHCSAHVPQNMYGTILVRENVQVNAAATEALPPTGSATQAAQVVPTTAPTLVLATTVPTAAPTRVPATLVPIAAPTVAPTATPLPEKQKVPEAQLPTQRFAAHFVRSEPEHADLLASAPLQVHVHFNFTLARNSNIEVRKDGEKLPLDAWALSENRLQMTINLPDAGAGMYHVLFNACWPDKSCHPGEFAFVVR